MFMWDIIGRSRGVTCAEGPTGRMSSFWIIHSSRSSRRGGARSKLVVAVAHALDFAVAGVVSSEFHVAHSEGMTVCWEATGLVRRARVQWMNGCGPSVPCYCEEEWFGRVKGRNGLPQHMTASALMNHGIGTKKQSYHKQERSRRSGILSISRRSDTSALPYEA